MLGQRRAFGVRVDSQKNINNALVENQKDSKPFAKPQLVKPQPLKPIFKQQPVEEKKPELKPVANIKTKAYGDRQCMVSEEMAGQIDQYVTMVEKARKIDTDFLKGEKIDGRMRGILIDWILQIQAKFNLLPETFYLSCFILDRVIGPLAVTRQNFQLVGLSSIFCASKFEEVIIPNVIDFLYMSGDFCTVKDLFEAEREVLKALKFRLTFTYPNHFLRKIRLTMPGDGNSDVYELSKLLVDISLIDYSSAHWLPSEAATASIYLACEILERQCPEGMSETVGIDTSATIEKSNLLKTRVPIHVNPNAKLRGLRLRYKESKALPLVDNYIASLN
jgi:hypothetical protein